MFLLLKGVLLTQLCKDVNQISEAQLYDYLSLRTIFLEFISYNHNLINTRDIIVTAWFLISVVSKDMNFLVVEAYASCNTTASEVYSSTQMISFSTPAIFNNHVIKQYHPITDAQ